jgi:ribosomal protein L11 methyltransferase
VEGTVPSPWHWSESDQVVIHLEPGMAFGTGLHPTTRLCLEALEAHLVPDCRVLDVGTGSGILAIAAAKLGARSVLAIDSDPVAIAVARENVISNRVAEGVTVRLGSLPGGLSQEWMPRRRDGGPLPYVVKDGDFDLVLVNILAPVIMGMAPALGARTRSGGRIIAAGLIESQETDIVRALRNQKLEIVGRAQEKDWVSLVAQRAEGGVQLRDDNQPSSA